VQINIGHLNEEGVYITGQFSTFALVGAVRAQVGSSPVPACRRTVVVCRPGALRGSGSGPSQDSVFSCLLCQIHTANRETALLCAL
jgi:hypothetical protein